MSWFTDPEVINNYTVVEVEKQSPLTESMDSISAVNSLSQHEGFRWLLKKLNIQAARLRSDLIHSRHDDIRQVEFLQSGIQWCGWLQSQLDLAHSKFLNMRPATNAEMLLFNELNSQIELIGNTTEPQSL